MRYAIFSDVHANLRAWEEALSDIRAQRVDVLVCLGDAVGYGPKPEEVLSGIRAVTKNFIIGNHEAAAAGMIDYSVFNDNAKHSTEWTKQALTAESHEFLKTAPIAIDTQDILFVHAEILEPGRFDYIDDQKKALENFTGSKHFVTFVGHTHHPKIFQLKGKRSVSEMPDQNQQLDPSCRYIINVGSVGEPRNAEDLRGVYVIYDSETLKVDFRRVAFDIEAYRAELESTTLNIKPFFLQCHDHQTAEAQLAPPFSEALSPAMEAPLISVSTLSQDAETVSLEVPSDTRKFRNSAVGKRSSVARKAVGLSLISVIVLGLLTWGVMHYIGSQVPDDSLVHSDDISTAKAEPTPPRDLSDPIPDTPQAIPAPPITKTDAPIVHDPKPNPTAIIPPPEPDPKPIVDIPPETDPTVAWWRMEPDSIGEKLIDSKNKSSLPMLAPGKTIGAIAPSALPPHDITNTAAMSLGVWVEPSPTGKFALRADRSFTCEGWFLVAKTRKAVFLAGTRSGDANDKQGWHIDIRPNGQMCFFYDNGPQIIHALSEKLPITDLKPHHFAAVWNHDASAGAGEMQLYLDGVKVKTAKVPHIKIPPTQANPFRIGAPKNPSKVALDEVRFSRGALGVSEFLRPDDQSLPKNGLVLNLVGDALAEIAKSVKAPHQPKLDRSKGMPMLQFDGKDDFISIPESDVLDLTAWTIVSLIQPTGGEGVVLGKADSKSTLINYRLMVYKDGKVGALVRGPTHHQQIHCKMNLNVMNRFSVVAARFDPAAKGINKITISVKGASGAYDLNLAKGPVGATMHNAPLMIGRQPGKNARHFKGDIGGILLYNRALSDEELASATKWLADQSSGSVKLTEDHKAAPVAAVEPAEAIVFLIAGEANAGGVAAFSEETVAKAKIKERYPVNPGTTAKNMKIPITTAAYPRSYIWKPQKGPFEQLTPSKNLQACYADRYRHGIELPMAMLLEKKFPHSHIFFIKHGPAKRNLYTQWKANNGSDYKFFHSQITPAMANLKKRYDNVRVVGMYWDQGESDEKQARRYEDNLQKLFAALREDTGLPDLPIYVREQGIFQHDKPEFKRIVDAQIKIANKDANTHLLKLDLGSNEKNYKAWAWSIGKNHLSSKAYLELSKMIIQIEAR